MNRPDITAKRLRIERKAHDLTQTELARLAHCHPSVVGMVERQERRLSVDLAIAFGKVLDVKPAWLLDLAD